MEAGSIWDRGNGWRRRPGVATYYGSRGVEVVGEAFGRWWRVVLVFGSPAGSRIGLWHTRVDAMRGLNLRVGRRYIGPCLTVFVHTRPSGR